MKKKHYFLVSFALLFLLFASFFSINNRKNEAKADSAESVICPCSSEAKKCNCANKSENQNRQNTCNCGK